MHLLVVDDSKVMRLSMFRLLKEAGYTDISEAKSAMEALEILDRLESDNQVPDLILLDIMMPGMSGIEACRAIKRREHAGDTPIIMVTAMTESQYLEDAFEAGAMDYITKPVNKTELVVRVRSALRLKQEMDRRKAREEELSRALRKIKDDITAAGEIQRNLLPSAGLSFDTIEMAWCFEPCETVGGDVFNVFSLNDTTLGFYILDVTGHGVKAALLSVTLSRLITAIDEARDCSLEPSVRHIRTRINEWTDCKQPDDDITILAMEVLRDES